MKEILNFIDHAPSFSDNISFSVSPEQFKDVYYYPMVKIFADDKTIIVDIYDKKVTIFKQR